MLSKILLLASSVVAASSDSSSKDVYFKQVDGKDEPEDTNRTGADELSIFDTIVKKVAKGLSGGEKKADSTIEQVTGMELPIDGDAINKQFRIIEKKVEDLERQLRKEKDSSDSAAAAASTPEAKKSGFFADFPTAGGGFPTNLIESGGHHDSKDSGSDGDKKKSNCPCSGMTMCAISLALLFASFAAYVTKKLRTINAKLENPLLANYTPMNV